MSLMMMLEMDRSASADFVRKAFARCGVDVPANGNDGFTGNFPSSNMFFSFSKDEKGTVKAEDFEGGWDVGAEITFVYVVSEMELCRKQLRCFVDHFSEIVACNWVLSFQYESVYAYGSASSMHWVKEL